MRAHFSFSDRNRDCMCTWKTRKEGHARGVRARANSTGHPPITFIYSLSSRAPSLSSKSVRRRHRLISFREHTQLQPPPFSSLCRARARPILPENTPPVFLQAHCLSEASSTSARSKHVICMRGRLHKKFARVCLSSPLATTRVEETREREREERGKFRERVGGRGGLERDEVVHESNHVDERKDDLGIAQLLHVHSRRIDPSCRNQTEGAKSRRLMKFRSAGAARWISGALLIRQIHGTHNSRAARIGIRSDIYTSSS